MLLLISIRICLRDTVDSLVRCLLRRQLRLALHERTVTHLICLLHKSVLGETKDAQTAEQREHTKQLAIRFVCLKCSVVVFCSSTLRFLLSGESLPSIAVTALGAQRLSTGLNRLFDCLQHARLNKQLSYQLLDVLVHKLFPNDVIKQHNQQHLSVKRHQQRAYTPI